MLTDGSWEAVPDYKGRATAAERRTQRFVSLREMRSILSGLDAMGNFDTVKDPNGVALSGIVVKATAKGNPRRASLQTYQFVGPFEVAKLLSSAKTWAQFTKGWKGQMTKRELVKDVLTFTEASPARKAAFMRFIDR